jgi:endonuclease VIII-like 1
MPELAEVRLMTEFFNSSTLGNRFKKVYKSAESKVQTDLSNIPPDTHGFSVKAHARGKETIIVLKGIDTQIERVLKVTYGMSGHWRKVSTWLDVPKHSHLMFEAFDGTVICLVDVRRFAKWKWTMSWSDNRGPDPTTEFELFVENLRTNSHRKIFDKPICELLMDQKYFNGIGNYLRAEILYRLDINPWTAAREAIKNIKLLELCRTVPLESYEIGGGSIKDWKNPYGNQYQTMDEWLQCYGKGESIIDNTGRTFWFNPKYNLMHETD